MADDKEKESNRRYVSFGANLWGRIEALTAKSGFTVQEYVRAAVRRAIAEDEVVKTKRKQPPVRETSPIVPPTDDDEPVTQPRVPAEGPRF